MLAWALPVEFGSLVFSSLTGFRCTFRDATPGQTYRTSPSLAAGGWSDITNVNYAGSTIIITARPSRSKNR